MVEIAMVEIALQCIDYIMYVPMDCSHVMHGSFPGTWEGLGGDWVVMCSSLPKTLALYPIYDQNFCFLLHYLWPNQNLNTLFMTLIAGTGTLNIHVSYETL